MSGRAEKDLAIENKVKEIVKNQPDVIKIYSQSFNGKTSNTKKLYVYHVIKFCKYLYNEFGIDMNDANSIKLLNYSHIISYLNYIKYHHPDGSNAKKEEYSCATELYAIKHFCKYLKLCKYISDNPCLEVEIPKDTKNHQVVSLTPEEIKLIQYNIIHGVGTTKARSTQEKWTNRNMCIVLIGITTGLRVSAIANIDMKDIDFDKQTIVTIEKGNVEREVFLSDKMMDVLNKWLKDRERLLGKYSINCDALFISAKKQRIGTTTIRDMLKTYTYNINKKITPHKLRSTAATNLYEATGDIYLVADVLGHKNIKNTIRYARVSDAKRTFAANELSKLI